MKRIKGTYLFLVIIISIPVAYSINMTLLPPTQPEIGNFSQGENSSTMDEVAALSDSSTQGRIFTKQSIQIYISTPILMLLVCIFLFQQFLLDPELRTYLQRALILSGFEIKVSPLQRKVKLHGFDVRIKGMFRLHTIIQGPYIDNCEEVGFYKMGNSCMTKCGIEQFPIKLVLLQKLIKQVT